MIDTTNITIGNRRLGDQGIYVGRPSALGNPYIVGTDGAAGTLIRPYRKWLRDKVAARDDAVLSALFEIVVELEQRGSVQLVCWCAPQPCHADAIRDVLAELDWCHECEDELAPACGDCAAHVRHRGNCFYIECCR